MRYGLLLLLLFCLQQTFAQADSSGNKRRPVYKTKVILMNEQRSRGFVSLITDTGIIITKHLKEVITARENTQFIYAEQIKSIRFRKKGSIGKGLAIGAGAGGFLTYVLTESTIDDGGFFGKSFSVTLFTFLGTYIGAIIGGALGSSYKYFAVNGNSIEFQKVYLALAESYKGSRSFK